MIFNQFSFRKPISYTNLPLTLMTLNDWILIIVSGHDSEKYLQGQVTADIEKINEHQYLLTAHCNANGKMWSNLHLFRYNKGFAFIERCSLLNLQLNELKKYAIFSEVTFKIDYNIVLLGIAGFNARIILTDLFGELPTAEKQIVSNGSVTLLWFKYPSERFMLITDKITAGYITTALCDKALFNNSEQWLALDIEGGIPVIDVVNSGKFVPQATNLQILGGISFKKGCYLGQEVVTKIKFRKANKHIMLCLTGTANRVPVAGENLELKIKNNYWRRTGTVLASVLLDSNRLLVQAVINKNIRSDDILRVCNDDVSILRIASLPYVLEEF